MTGDRVGWDCVCMCLYMSMCRRWHYKCTYTFRWTQTNKLSILIKESNSCGR